MTILKIRTVRAEFFDTEIEDAAHASVDGPTEHDPWRKAFSQLLTLDRYEQRARSRRRHALRQLREPTALR
jgi:hypothetical protein